MKTAIQYTNAAAEMEAGFVVMPLGILSHCPSRS